MNDDSTMPTLLISAIASAATCIALVYAYFQVRLSKIQSLNVHNFKVHEIFMEYPEFRDDFYPYPGYICRSFAELDPDDRRRAQAIAGYILDFFDLIVFVDHNYGWKTRSEKKVIQCYLDYVNWSLAHSRFLQDYLWANPYYFATLKTHKRLRVPDPALEPQDDAPPSEG